MLDYGWLLRLVPLAACLLPLVGGVVLARQDRPRGRYAVAALIVGLVAALMYFNGLITGVGWIVEGGLSFVPAALIGISLGYSATMLKHGRYARAGITLLLAGTALAGWAAAAGGLFGLATPYNGWGLALLLPLIGGFALASAYTARQLRRTRYVAFWLLFAGTIGVGAYMNQMEGITYAFVAPERMFGSYAAVRVMEAVLASAGATALYVAGSLLLLMLPLGTRGWVGLRPSSAQPGR